MRVHALSGKDEVCIANADFTMVSGKDGIHADNEDDASLGYVYIQSGTFSIDAEGDGISASSGCRLRMAASISRLEAEALTPHPQAQTLGEFQGGGRHGGSQMNGFTGNSSGTSAAETDSTDSTSMKGIKASDSLTINGGTFAIDLR
ncbi:MAG: carbohydrate-binding domain-containing protein [Bianqueaceae bacterium]